MNNPEGNMDAKKLGAIRPVAGAAGAALIASLFMQWAQGPGAEYSVWDFEAGVGILTFCTGLIAITAAATDGRVGLFRPDVSMSGAADLFGVATALVVGALALFDLPSATDAGLGVFVALGAAVVVAGVCGDYRVLRGAPLFPR